MENNFDFSGWATRANVKCSDGRTIMKDAFKHNDGKTVPLVWNHQHNDPNEVLGHALLENRDEGVYVYGKFNDTESGQTAKKLVQHGDIDALSIYANKLKEQMSCVLHGDIREVSLVLAGANPGAFIESVIAHGEESDTEAIIYSGMEIALAHAGCGSPKSQSNTEDEDKKKELEHSKEEADKPEEPEEKGDTKMAEQKTTTAPKAEEPKKDAGEKTVGEIFDSLTEEQKNVVYAIIGQALESKGDDEEDDEESKGGEGQMKHNAFDQEEQYNENTLSHSEMNEIFEDAKRCGSLKESFLSHGITDIDFMFPDAQNVTNQVEFIKRDDSWVADVLAGVHKTPFSRIKTIFADITEDEARARGYVKGNKKVEEVFKMLKRVTTPTTIYKKQKLDRDDIVDITDIDVIGMLKGEMKMMLNEETARAILVGDGRGSDSPDKINEENIRPIWKDDDLYTVKAAVNVSAGMTNDQKAKAFIKECVKSRKQYKGSGNPVMYISEDMLTDCLLIEDTNGRVIYDTIEKLATALRVRKIVPVTVMENLTRIVGDKTHTLAAIYVNLNDYNVGATRGGEINFFDDFDIDYNQQKYLIETRCSGALIKPYAAVALEFVEATAEG